MSEIYEEHQERNPGRRTTDSFESCPRFDKHELTEEQMEDIATRAAAKTLAKAKQEMYAGVGEAVLSKAYIIVGFLCFVTYVLLVKLGIIKP